LISESVFLTAAHCKSITQVHFTFDTSDAPPEDQYEVELSSYRRGDTEDWAVGHLLDNSITLKLPGVAQSEKCGKPGCGWYTFGDVPSKVDGNSITITGYGQIMPTLIQPQTTHTGALLEIKDNTLHYKAHSMVSLLQKLILLRFMNLTIDNTNNPRLILHII
jgi:V8-like Glu-specific endopeptidase